MFLSQPFIILFLSFVIGLSCNFLRFNLRNNLLNKYFLTITSLLLIIIHATYTGISNIDIMVLFFISVAAFCFQVKGGMVAAILSWLYIILITGHLNLFLLSLYILVGGIIGYTVNQYDKKKIEEQKWLIDLISQAKQLHVYREINLSMQQTLQLKRLLRVILISVTAGHGLGFNRAMIFLTVDGNKLRGIMGIGPMSPKEGFNVWDNLAERNYKLMDIIKMNYNDQETDPDLNAIIKSLTIDLDHNNILEKALRNEKPYHVKEIDKTDKAQVIFSNYFHMGEFAAIPLINQGNHIGVLIVDNIVNKKPITNEEIDSAIPLANQAAIAIEHANLYKKVKDMALRDGLTGLLNQRALESTLEQAFSSTKVINEPLSVIIFDIDFFKQYNDTNGHLLGNEVLIKLSSTVENTIREKDLAFRFGGEEFLVLLQNTTTDKAYYIAERIRSNIEKTIFPNGNNQPLGALTISLGVCSTEDGEFETKNDLINAADKALYLAKKSGKNKVMLFKEYKHE